jgi:predicted phosphoribosyltransferase
MPAPFEDRGEGGRALARRLRHLASRRDVIVLALPRGGVPAGFEVARALGALLDVFMVRTLGAPRHAHLALGAVASGGVELMNPVTIRMCGERQDAVRHAFDIERRVLAIRERVLRGGAPMLDVRGRTVVLVSDDLGSGAGMAAAVLALRELSPSFIIAAAPVGHADVRSALRDIADDCVCIAAPGEHEGRDTGYAVLAEPGDAEMRRLLADARAAHAPPRPTRTEVACTAPS